LVVVASVLGSVNVFGPVLMVALVRAGRGKLAGTLVKLLYRTDGGRAAVGRLLAQAALQVGDTRAARELAGSTDASVLTQALQQERDWDGVLALGADPGLVSSSTRAAPVVGNEWLLAEARIEALVELDRLAEARAEVQAMNATFDATPAAQTPLAFRSLTLSKARVAAAAGDVESVKALVQQSMVGVRPATLYGILGRAADRAGAHEAAVKLFTQAAAEGRGRPRGFYEAEVVRLGGTVPARSVVTVTKTPVTLVLVAVLAVAYGAQVLVDRVSGLVIVLGQYIDPSTLIAAYVQGIPGLPAAGAWWRNLTYAFVHGNLVHVGFNLWVLFDIGRMYERRRGWGDLLAAFVIGTAGGAWLTSVMQAGQPLVLVGASGGVLGLAGALLADALFSRSGTDMTLVRSLLQWMALILLFSVLPGVSLWGHAGGVMGGFVYGALRGRVPGRTTGTVVGSAAACLLALALFSAVSTMVPLLP
jgi:rhomboid protease GluP